LHNENKYHKQSLIHCSATALDVNTNNYLT